MAASYIAQKISRYVVLESRTRILDLNRSRALSLIVVSNIHVYDSLTLFLEGCRSDVDT